MASFNPTPHKSYEHLKSKSVQVVDLLKYHFSEIVSSINRRITQKERYRNPWKITFDRTIHSSLYLPFYKALRDYEIDFGRKISVKRCSRGNIKNIDIVFSHFGCFVFHLSQVLGIEKDKLRERFTTRWKGGNVTQIIVSEDKPFLFHYNVTKHTLKIEGSLSLTNKYGTVCSH